MLSAEPSEPCGLVCLAGSKHLYRSILPAVVVPGKPDPTTAPHGRQDSARLRRSQTCRPTSRRLPTPPSILCSGQFANTLTRRQIRIALYVV